MWMKQEKHSIGDLVMYKFIENDFTPPVLGMINKITQKSFWKETKKVTVYHVDWCDGFISEPDNSYTEQEIDQLKMNVEQYRKNNNGQI